MAEEFTHCSAGIIRYNNLFITIIYPKLVPETEKKDPCCFLDGLHCTVALIHICVWFVFFFSFFYINNYRIPVLSLVLYVS